ncbi:MAG: IS66 family transposase [Blastocatellia bacterium]
MNLNIDPAQLSTEQLLELVRQMIAEIEKLRAENEELKRKNARQAAPFSKNKRKKNPKRPGRKPGQGVFRHRSAPSEEDYSQPPIEVPVTENSCPGCGGDLVADGEEVVTNTDLPEMPKPIIKAYRVQMCKCGKCGKRVRGRHPEVAPDQRGATAHRLGPRALALAALIFYGVGTPQRKIPFLLLLMTGLKVTQGALTQSAIRAGVGDGAVARRYQQHRQEIKEQETINTDDTGWRVGGERAQMMVFESSETAVYQIRPQHRNEEVREVIGDNYQGTLATDRGRSYDAKELEGVNQQKCLSHIQRSIDEVLESKRGWARGFGKILKSQLKEAVELHKTFHDPAKKLPDYQRRVRELEAEITDHLRPRNLTNPDNQRLLNELGRHHDRGNLLRFLHNPVEVEPTNNAAERALRPAVIARKVSQCSKTETGARARESFLSVIRTMLKREADKALENLTELFSNSPPPEKALSAPT